MYLVTLHLWVYAMYPHLCVRGEPGFGLGPGHSALGGSAGLRQAGGAAAAAAGEGGLGPGLVQRQLEPFILRLAKHTSIHSQLNPLCFAFHIYKQSLITQGQIPVSLKGCLLITQTAHVYLHVWFFSKCKKTH